MSTGLLKEKRKFCKNGIDPLLKKASLSLFINDTGQVPPTKKMLTKQRPTRKKVLSFEEIDDPLIVKQRTDHIEHLNKELNGTELISLKEWCESKYIDQAALVRLLK